jgi:F0F1-type ATP synthase assembly protein I
MNGGDNRGRRIRNLRTAAMLSTVGLTMALSVAIGVAIGFLLDQAFKTNWLVIVFTVIGVIAGFKQMIQTVSRANEEQEALDREERARNPEDGPRDA